MLALDTYKTIVNPSKEVIFKDRGSKFFGYAYPLQDESQVKEIVENLKKSHHKARHWCFAWQLGVEKVQFRVNDDGEPNNSAGQPIYGQVLSKELTNVLIVVVRYFGGTKLGVGGLVNAYKTTAQYALEASKIIVKTIDVHYKLIFDYQYMNSIMRIVKEYDIVLIQQKMEMNCEFIVAVRKNESKKMEQIFSELRHVKITKI